jgi:hypothetical protein
MIKLAKMGLCDKAMRSTIDAEVIQLCRAFDKILELTIAEKMQISVRRGEGIGVSEN